MADKDKGKGAPTRRFADGSFYAHVNVNGNVRHNDSFNAALKALRDTVARINSRSSASSNR